MNIEAAIISIYLIIAFTTPFSPIGCAEDEEVSPPTENGGKVSIDKIAFSSNRDGNWEIYAMDSDGKNQRNLTKNPADDLQPAWSPDGSRIAFVRDGDIFVMDADGENKQNLTNNPKESNEGPVWSPDGKKIAFTSRRERLPKVYIMDVDGGNQRLLTDALEVSVTPAWSPDSKQIAFSYLLGIAIFDFRTLDLKQFPSASWPIDLAWSPNGKKIAFVSSVKANSYADGEIWIPGVPPPDAEIWVMNADGTGAKNVTNNPANDENPAWSPNSAEIAFASDRDGNWEIYTMRANGKEQKNLTNSPADDITPAWR